MKKTTLLFTGDYYSYPRLEAYCTNNHKSKLIFGDLLSELNEADIAGINIEFPITSSNNAIRKSGPNLKGSPVTLEPLKEAGFNLAYISNNHTLDFGEEGLKDTIANLNLNGMYPIGIGENLEDARKPFIKEINGLKLAFLNFSENEFNVATEKTPGANPLNIINNIRDIRKAKNDADYVFVIIHAGQDFNHYPPPFMLDQFRFYAEEGASAIICHHSHYIAGYEEHIDVPIFYGLGNIVYPNQVEKERQKTLVVKFTLEKEKLNYKVIPYFFDTNEMKLKYAGKNSEHDFTTQLTELSLVLKNYELNKMKWFENIRKLEYYRYLTIIGGHPHIMFKIFKKIGVLKIIERMAYARSKKHLQIWNMIRRETHRNALLQIFTDMFSKK